MGPNISSNLHVIMLWFVLQATPPARAAPWTHPPNMVETVFLAKLMPNIIHIPSGRPARRSGAFETGVYKASVTGLVNPGCLDACASLHRVG
jgi:hypothetical protein